MKKRIPFLIVVSLIIFYATANYIWLKSDARPLWFDFGLYFDRSIDLYESLQAGPRNFIRALLGWGDYSDAFHSHRIILPLVSLPAYWLFGISEDVAVMSLLAVFIILVLSVYGIVKEISNR